MGYNNTSTNIQLTANFTVLGRQQLLTNSSNIITHFALGDSDANYGGAKPLLSGQVPASSGKLASNGSSSNSVADGYMPKSLLYFNSLGETKAPIGSGSSNVTKETNLIGQTTLSAGTSGLTMTQELVNRNDFETDPLVNLFHTFRLPITPSDDIFFTGTTSSRGGFGDTALSGLSQDEILVIGIKNEHYGEMLDGKSIKVTLTDTTNTTFTLFGTYEKGLVSDNTQDASYKEMSISGNFLGGNVTFLFSDDIQKPNNDTNKSWSTGHFTSKPFSKSNKSLFNLKNNDSLGVVADKVVGVASLDKGFIVITDPTIIANFDPSHANAALTTISFDSISTQVNQVITCVVDRGQFTSSSNSTWSLGDKVRVSEVLLLDSQANVLALAKTDRHIELNGNQFMVLNIKISV